MTTWEKQRENGHAKRCLPARVPLQLIAAAASAEQETRLDAHEFLETFYTTAHARAEQTRKD